MKAPFIAASLIAIVATSSHAQSDNDLGKDLNNCRALSNPEKRLSCYDGIADSLTSRAEQRQKETQEAIEAAREIAEQNFGLKESNKNNEIPETKQVSSETRAILKAAEGPEAISSVITKVEKKGSGKTIIYLDNGQAWIETSASRFRGKPKVGETATITKEGLGWFRIRFSKTYGVLAARRIR
ncbi:MAG: hypothetical protein PVF65_09950 [Sphingomonadales bacterium]|jgi:hypothetical protein